MYDQLEITFANCHMFQCAHLVKEHKQRLKDFDKAGGGSTSATTR